MSRKFSFSLTIALVMALLVTAIVLADNLLTDGDGLTPVVDTPSLALGNVCTGTTVTKTIFHAIDASGHPGTGTQVFDNEAVVTVSVTSTSGTGLSAVGGNTVTMPSDWTTQANGAKSDSASSTITFVAGSTPRSFSGTVNYSASGLGSKPDKNGIKSNIERTDSLTVTATVVNCDTTAPTLNLPADMTVEATSVSGAVVSFTATADDANPAHPAVTCTPDSGSTFDFGTTTVNCSATDALNNTANGSFKVTVQDTTAPTVTTPSNITVEAADFTGAVVTYSGESAADTVDGMLAPACAPASGSKFPLGKTTVTCSATDSHSNTGATSFTVDVQDTTAPVLSLPSDITKEATSAEGAAVDFSASASDLVDGAVTVSCDYNPGDTFKLGTTVVSCSATDSNDNSSSGAFNISVVDTTAPELSLPADFSLEATGPNGAVATFETSATDLVDGAVAVSCAPASGSTFGLGANAVACSATDANKNTASREFTITVVDTTAPELTLPADQQLEATGPDGAVATFTATATDLVDGTVPVSCDYNSGATFPLGTTTLKCSVEDAAGNKASGSFVIIVEDTTAPTITYTGRTAANTNGWNNGAVTVTWSCTDLVGVKTASVSATVSAEGANQSATGACEDTSGNTASDTQGGINIDQTAPAAFASRAPNANSTGWNNSDVTVTFSGEDALSGIDFCADAQTFGEGKDQFASGTCADKAGNTSNPATVTNINVDKTAPTITGAPDRAANGNGWYNATVTVSFSCDDALSGVASCTAPSSLGEGAGQGVGGTVTDQAGNSASATVSGINIDETTPEIFAALDKSAAASGWFNSSTGAPTVSFSCSDALSRLDGVCPAPHTFGDGAGQFYNQSVTDLAGNTASAGVSGVNVDTVAPSITGAPDRPANGNNWYNADVTVTFSCSDGTSGVDSCAGASTLAEGAAQSVTGNASDVAGNTASYTVSGINIDKTAPVVSLVGGPAGGQSYYFGSVPAAPTCSASDGLSGLDGSCSVSGYGNAVGSYKVEASATDKAGNTSKASASYTVLAWTLNGFFQPVDMGKLNIAKNGSTVPLKFEAFAGSTELTSTSIISTFIQKESCLTFTSDDIETYATGATSLRYDATSGQFIFNWQTPKVVGGCYKVTLSLQDGTSISADFKLK